MEFLGTNPLASYRPNRSSVTAPPPTNVSFVTYQNTYVYSAAKLWLAYGLAILFAFLATMVGLMSLYINGSSYSNTFSTVMRITRDAQLSVEISKEDGTGANPLPAYIANATISFRGSSVPDRQMKEEGAVDQQGAKTPSATSALLSDSGGTTTQQGQ
jgi:hypothetical protein